LSKDGKEVYHCFSQSSFAEYAIVGEFTAAKVRDDAPFDKICGIACAIGTGLGAVVKHPRFHMEVGAKVAVIGCGTVGLSAIMGANLVGAGKIVAIDMFDNKLALAKELGATHTINASKEDAVARTVMEVGTVDYAFECIGKAVTVNQAYDMTNMQGGIVVIVGAMPMGEMVSFEGFYLGTCAKSVVGVGAGFMSPKYDVPRYVDLYMDGKLPLDKLVTHHYKLEDVNQAIDDLEKGVSVKGVILP
jgi:S-(hydroxymethyl)glutathione dehydrogenase/alcohol dehydrogenase